MITRTLFARGAASVILAGALVLGTAGCVFITPQATLNQYDPTDGISATLGDIAVRHTLGIISEDGKSISLMTTLINTGAGAHGVDLQFSSDGKKTTVTKFVKPGSYAAFGNTPEEDQIVIANSGVPAGGLLPVYVQWGKEPGKQMMVPVLEASGDYATLAPAATTP